MMYFSKDTGGFYDRTIHSVIPANAVEITNELHAQLLEGQAKGRVISAGEDGYPLLIDPPQSLASLKSNERSWRDAQLFTTDGIISRHRDESEDGENTTLTVLQYTQLQAYRRSLRNWPESDGFPHLQFRPSAPQWLAPEPE